VLLPPVEPSQYASILYTDRLGDFNIDASIGTVGDSYDNALAESMFAIFKTELFRNPAVFADHGGHWKGLDDLTPAVVEADNVDHTQFNAALEKQSNEPPKTQAESNWSTNASSDHTIRPAN
jgi:transposase InsO family protein